MPFWVAVDLVIAMPISWLPLVADYNRFANKTKEAFWGTFWGYFITNTWFYALGAIILLAVGISQEPKGFVSSIALTAGWVALIILLVDETDNAWADLYSAAVSTQNIFPRIKQIWLILGLGLFSFLIAVVLDITQFENFLLLAGSFFIPLFGILAADYFLVRRSRYQVSELYHEKSGYLKMESFNVWGMIAWITGIVVYNITNPVTLGALIPAWAGLIPSSLTILGGSLPSFSAALVIYSILGFAFIRRAPIQGSSSKVLSERRD